MVWPCSLCHSGQHISTCLQFHQMCFLFWKVDFEGTVTFVLTMKMVQNNYSNECYTTGKLSIIGYNTRRIELTNRVSLLHRIHGRGCKPFLQWHWWQTFCRSRNNDCRSVQCNKNINYRETLFVRQNWHQNLRGNMLT